MQAEILLARGVWAAFAVLWFIVMLATVTLLIGIANERRATITLYRSQGARWWHLTPIFATGPAVTVLLAGTVSLTGVTMLVPGWLSRQLQQLLPQLDLSSTPALGMLGGSFPAA